MASYSTGQNFYKNTSESAAEGVKKNCAQNEKNG